LFALLVFAVICFYRYRKSLKRLLWELLPGLPLCVFIVFWIVHESRLNSYMSLSSLGEYYLGEWIQKSMKLRGELFFFDNYFLFKGLGGQIAALFFVLFILFPLGSHWLNRKKVSMPENLKQVSASLYIFLFVALFFFLFIPHRIWGFFYLPARFSVFILLSFVFMGSFFSKSWDAKISKVVFVLLCLLHFGLWGQYFTAFNSENRQFTREIFPQKERFNPVGGLIYAYLFRGNPVYIHFPNYHIVWNQGIVPTCVVDYTFGSVRRIVDERRLPSNIRMEWEGRRKKYNGRFSNLDYILVKGKIPEKHLVFFKDFRVQKSTADWTLYKKYRGGDASDVE
jgi:hypothetical protein